MTVVITASHIDCEERKGFLKKAINSVLLLNVSKHFISLSTKEGIVAPKKEELSNDERLEIIYSEKRLFQFDHIERLLSKINDDDKVIMLDDDDLLLEIPKEDIVKGQQWIPFLSQRPSKELEQADHTFPFEKVCEKISDLSGYTMTGSILKEYFAQREFPASGILGEKLDNMFKNLEDCRFMNFIDMKGAVKPEKPFVFRRIWSNPRSWFR